MDGLGWLFQPTQQNYIFCKECENKHLKLTKHSSRLKRYFCSLCLSLSPAGSKWYINIFRHNGTSSFQRTINIFFIHTAKQETWKTFSFIKREGATVFVGGQKEDHRDLLDFPCKAISASPPHGLFVIWMRVLSSSFSRRLFSHWIANINLSSPAP